MSVNDLKRGRIGYREVVWCDTDERPCCANFRCRPRRSEKEVFLRSELTILLVHLVNNF